MNNDPFADIVDEPETTTAGLRDQLLGSARRGFVPLRKTFVQRPRGETSRASVLTDLVTNRKHRELKLLLLLHALHPILGEPLPLRTWATMTHGPAIPCTPTQASEAFTVLAGRNLVVRSPKGQPFQVAPLLEDGSGEPFIQAGRPGTDVGPGYLTIPHEFWTTGLVDQLTLPGTALFLIALAETTKKTSFEMAVERAKPYYGISERTAERGYKELNAAGVLLTHGQTVNDPRSSTGRRVRYHRALTSPYSTGARIELQKATRNATRARATAEG